MDIKKLFAKASEFEQLIANASKRKEKKERELDPKAKTRNRGDVVFPAKSPKVLDNKDHFELNDIGQARSALARSHQYDKAPPWYKGSLKSLQEAVRRKVHSKYPSIEIGDSKSKKSDFVDKLIRKFGQTGDPLEGFSPDTRTPEQIAADVRKNFPYLYPKEAPSISTKAPMRMMGGLPTDLLSMMQTKLPRYSGKISLHLAPDSNVITAHYNLNAFGPNQANQVKADLMNALRGTKYQLNSTVVGVKPDVDELDMMGYAFNW